jgi:hypothetical protein
MVELALLPPLAANHSLLKSLLVERVHICAGIMEHHHSTHTHAGLERVERWSIKDDEAGGMAHNRR